MLQCDASQTHVWGQRGILHCVVELVNFGCHRQYCGMGVKSNHLPPSISLNGKSQGTARRCLPVDQSPKSPTEAWIALLLGQCWSMQLFLDMALRQERSWKGWEHQLCSCWQHLLSLSAGGWGSTESGWQEAEHACEELPMPRSDSFFWGLAGDGTPGGQFCWHGEYQTAIQSWTADVNWRWVCHALQNPCA